MSKLDASTMLITVMISIVLVFVLFYLFFPRYYTIPRVGYNHINYVPTVPVYSSYVVKRRGPRRMRRGRRIFL